VERGRLEEYQMERNVKYLLLLALCWFVLCGADLKIIWNPNAETDLYISFTATRPASPEISITNGNSTANLSQLILLQPSYAGNQYTVYFDQIYLDDEEISTVCD